MVSALRVLIKYWPAVLAAVILLLWFLWQGAQEGAQVAEQRAVRAEADLQTTREQVDRVRANAATAALIAEQMNRGVNDELAKNPDWGAQRTPDGIVVELCQHLRCTEPSRTVRAP